MKGGAWHSCSGAEALQTSLREAKIIFAIACAWFCFFCGNDFLILCLSCPFNELNGLSTALLVYWSLLGNETVQASLIFNDGQGEWYDGDYGLLI